MHRIAMLDPVSDAGIGGYAHELADALVRAGCQVDLYTRRVAFATQFPRAYRQVPVLGRPLAAQHGRLHDAFRGRVTRPGGRWSAPPAWHRAAPEWREHALSLELATFMARRGYDAVWTQWPTLFAQEGVFRAACRGFGIPVIHTVHNVVPHESTAEDREVAHNAYRHADALVVHSAAAERALHAFAPDSVGRSVVSAHGLYTTYPRQPAARTDTRRALGAAEEDTLILIFGGIRPYKNVDACLDALARTTHPRLRLAICGWEYGFPDGASDDPLAHSRRHAAVAGVGDRLHLACGPFDAQQTARLFEAADAVVLPYGESWGSGQLLMGMSFGRTVIASAAGGMHEYLAHYADAVPLADTSPGTIASAFDALCDARPHAPDHAVRPHALEWDVIVPALLDRLRERLSAAAAPRTSQPSVPRHSASGAPRSPLAPPRVTTRSLSPH